jgi:GTP-binding protein
MVIANKADLLAAEGDPEEERLARAKLAGLEEFVRDEMDHDDRVLDVVLTSEKYSENLRSVVRKLPTYVEGARSASRTTPMPSTCPGAAVVTVIHILSTLYTNL